MQNFKTCHNCAKQLESWANWCSKCGTSLSSLSNKPKEEQDPPQQKQAKKPNFVMPVLAGVNDEDDDEDGESVNYFQLRQNALAVEIIKDNIPIERMGFGAEPAPQAGKKKKSTK